MPNSNPSSAPYIALALSFALLAPAAACSSDGDNSGGTGGMSGTGGAPPTGPQGNFNVQLFEANAELSSPARSAVIGIIADGPTPAQIQMKLDSSNGDCQLYIPWAPFCSTACGTAICTADDTCTPYPKWLDVGTVTVTGLGADLMLTAVAGNYQGPTLPFPPCTEGGAISVTSSTFSMHSKCIAPLLVTTPAPIPVRASMPVALAWTPPAAGTGSRVKILLDIAHHGGEKGEIRCDVADTGSFSIPEPLVTKLVNLGLAGFPTIGLERYTVGADAANANIKVLVSAPVERSVDTGVLSCTEDKDCPTGKACDSSGDKTCK
jgi:hypothetical protein